jgi:hypoxanthine phosphoribosyltransferase
VSGEIKPIYSAKQVAERVSNLGVQISRDYAGQTLDVVVLLEDAFFFASDLVRRISCPVACHFVSAAVRDVEETGHQRREILFSVRPNLKGRNVLVVDAVLATGVTMDFLIKRLQEDRPRSLRLAVLVDKPEGRRVDLTPDYFGFVGASKYLAGYGLAGSRGRFRNLPYIGEVAGGRPNAPRRAVRTKKATRRRGKS